MDKAFKELKDEGVDLSSLVRGYIMFRQANLGTTQEDQVTTWTQGQYERSDVVKALRKLEKVQKDRGSKSYMTADYDAPEEDDGIFWEDDDDENFVYVGEGDLDQIFEEADLQEALATYQQVRRALRDQRNSRGWQPPGKGGGKIQFGPSGKGGFRPNGKGTRVHQDALKV